MRVKPVTQIAIEVMALKIIEQTRKKDVSANDALWAWIMQTDPEIAEEAKRRAIDEGYSPREAGFVADT